MELKVTVFYIQMNSSTMNFCRGRDQRAFLGDGWRQFVTENGFRKDDTVTFYVLRPQRGGGIVIEPAHFQVIRHEPPPEGNKRARGFDLNHPPPPAN